MKTTASGRFTQKIPRIFKTALRDEWSLLHLERRIKQIRGRHKRAAASH